MASGLSTLIQPSLILAKELSSPLFLNALKKKKRKMQTHTKIMSTKGYLSFLSMQIILFLSPFNLSDSSDCKIQKAILASTE